MEEMQQLFGKRLEELMQEKNITQQDLAKAMGCSRQSINFYVLGKRSPDIVTAGKLADYLGVSCDYLIGLSDYRYQKESHFTVEQVGISEEAMKVFAGLKIASLGKNETLKEKAKELGLNYEQEILPLVASDGKTTLALLNHLISHDAFGVMLHYIRQYKVIKTECNSEENLKDVIREFVSPVTGKKYGSVKEKHQTVEDFYLYIILQYMSQIVKDIVK